MALIRLLPIAPNLNVIPRRWICFGIGIFVVLASCVSLGVKGLNFGVDFRGGILMEVRTEGPADLADLRSRVGSLGLGEVTLQEFGEPTDVLINIERQQGEEAEQIAAVERVKQAIGDKVVDYRRVEFVGPKVGEELKEAGLLATVLALAAIAAYVWFRFEWQYAAGALLALMHDVIGTIGFFSITGLEFNLASVAAVLTVAGYSINDTVVIADRVRENLRRFKKAPLPEVLNRSINETLSRTIITGLTTIIALVALSLFGGEVIRGFSLALVWGVLIGTYSSIGIAVPLLLYTGVRRSDLAPKEATGEVS
ncbi:protein translocase subunit SecF [Limibacillus halophilus]